MSDKPENNESRENEENDCDALIPSRLSYRWFMLAGVWFIYCCFGLVLASMAPLVQVITGDLQLSLSAMGSILGAWPLVYIGAAIPAGTLLDRFGLRRSLLIAALLIGLSGALRAVAVDGLTLFFAVALFGIGGPLVSVGAPKLISEWFGDGDRGLAIGIYMTGPAIGGIAALMLTNSVLMPLTGDSWRLTLLLYASVSLLAAGAWWIISSNPISKRVEARAGGGNKKLAWHVYPELLRLKVVRLVLLMGIGEFIYFHGFHNWLPEILRHGGMTPVAAGYWAAVPAVTGIAGALLIPRLATPARRIPLLIALFIGAALAVLLLAGDNLGVLVFALVLQGVARSAMMPITMLILMESKAVDHRNMGAAGGLFFTAAEVGGVLGPLSLGVLADVTGGFDLSLYLLAGLCVLLALLALRLRVELR